MEIRPLRTPEDHAWALGELETLWDVARPGTPEGDRFEVLATLVDVYEKEHSPVLPPDPIEAIRFRVEQRSLSNKDLESILGSRARVSEVMGRKRRLSIDMIRAAIEKLEIPALSLIQPYRLVVTTKAKGKKTKRGRPTMPASPGDP